MGQYSELVEEVRAAFNSGKTKTEEWRLTQLHGLMNMLKENEEKICEALYKDLHKCKFEASIMEINVCLGDVVDAINNLSNWMKPEKVAKGSIYMTDSAYMHYEPFGVTLIVGAWNYPLQLTLLPIIGAVAAGNCAILKPSELSEQTALFLEEYLPKYVDKDCVKVVNGAVPETTALLEEKFDLIFYTGSTNVGKIIMAAAAKHLTPVVLELGGKSPVYIDDSLDLKVVANRISWGKFINAGQTCVAPDYILCPSNVQDGLINAFKDTIKEFYSENPQKSASYARIVNERHFQRIEKLKEGCNIAIGGESDEKDKYIAPTVVRDVKPMDDIMQNEIFGPVLPIMPVKDHEEAIKIINNREKPLSLYLFTNKSNVMSDFRIKTSSGALLVNDTVVHGGLNTLPFGGVGSSGLGAYHGKHTFDSFSHRKAVLEKSLGLERMNHLRYPPFTDSKMGWLNMLLTKKVKRKGIFSFLPFMVLGTVLAVMFKTIGVASESYSSSKQE